jgi:hypothetical protein
MPFPSLSYIKQNLGVSIRGQLETQASFTSGIGQGGYSPVVELTAPVKDNLGNASFQSPLSYQFADSRSRLLGCPRLIFEYVGFNCRCGHQSMVSRVINDLSIDVLVRAKDGQTGPLRGAKHAAANAGVTATG